MAPISTLLPETLIPARSFKELKSIKSEGADKRNFIA
jgi:hypothetical protein